MKNIFKLLAFVLLVSSCQEQQKIAFVNNGDLVDNFTMKKDIEAVYKERNEVFQRRVDSIDQAFQVEVKAFQLAAEKMSNKRAQEKYNELGQRNQALSQQFQQDKQVLQVGYNKEMDSVIKTVSEFVENYGKEKGYTFILTKNSLSGIMYGDASKDITEEVTKALNADFKAKVEKEEKKKKNT